MQRKYFSYGVADLERELDANCNNTTVLEELAAELAHRSTDRSRALRTRVAEALAKSQPRRTTPSADRKSRLASELEGVEVDQHKRTAVDRPAPKITNEPVDIIRAWTALEVLAPPVFTRPEALCGGDYRNVARLQRGLPWERGDKAKPGKRVYYQIVLGTLDFPKAMDSLSRIFIDNRIERPQVRGECPLAVIIVDKNGRPIPDNPVVIASFGWALQQALDGRIGMLADWAEAEKLLVEALKRRLGLDKAEAEPAPLNAKTIDAAYRSLVAALKLPSALVKPHTFAVRSFVGFKSSEHPESLLVNSFFLRDLAKARGLLQRDAAPLGLRQYLGSITPITRRNLLRDSAALEAALMPARYPKARWPGRGRHPLVVLQQAAVNLALSELRDGGVLGVNGPPGTGKTTLLRDLVAAVVSERAEAMCTFDDPETAFSNSGQKLRAGNSWIHLYGLDSSLKGFELLVASSNNKAVENVSAELPAIGAVADDEPDLRYFKTASDALLERDSWGLIAAVLGNASNRYRFRQTFWWDRDTGLSTYLAAASGSSQRVEEAANDPQKPIRERPPLIVTAEHPPTNRREAIARWIEVRRQFEQAQRVSNDHLALLEQVRARCVILPDIRDALAATATATRLRPGWWSRLFRLRRWREWRRAASDAVFLLKQSFSEAARCDALPISLAAALSRLIERPDVSLQQVADLAGQIDTLLHEAQRHRARISERFVDQTFLDQPHECLHRSTAWLDEEGQRNRDNVFTAAMAVHKAFIDAAARPLRHNLGALMGVFGGTPLSTPEKKAVLPDLWSSLFLVTPVISTTFASVDRMLGALPPQSLGWLLIDEAGQSTPQSAVGGLLLCKRTVVVGDPIQVPPVVTLPDTLTDAVQRHFGVDPDRFNAPAASAQTLADSATVYTGEFEGKTGSRTVGVPLLVHRRCDEPMFGIANEIAYDRLMVQAKAQIPSRIRETLGASGWIDAGSGGIDKWNPVEGEMTIGLLTALRSAGVVPDLYVVTPFVVVKDNLRRLLLESGLLSGWVDSPEQWVRDRVGTVHTVQGREAESVIFVLGAATPSHRGARGWAGGQPNLLNVAVTRAKESLYVIGHREVWKSAGVFAELARRLREKSAALE